MADTKINIDLSPESVIRAMRDMGDETKKLAQAMEEALGKRAVENVDKLQKSSEKGSNQISTFFRNMGQRVREDLRTAFDATGIMAGTKLAREIGEGVKSVFEMERAFDRLNTRLQLTGRTFLDFKKNVGGAVAATGQRLEDVLPGVETMAARGNVRDQGNLTQMAGMLAQVRATTGEDVSQLADTVVSVLKDQQKEVTARNAQSVLDTLQAARTRGAFQTAGEAGGAVKSISPYAKQMGLGTEQLGGLAAVASQAGGSGQKILEQLMKSASEMGGATQLNATLGQNVFREGGQGQAVGMNAGALGRVNMQNPQIMEKITGLTGASGADLARFVDAFKNGMGKFDEVTHSFGETQKQFDLATDNFSTSVAKFKQKTIEASREIGTGLSAAAQALTKGDFRGAAGGLTAAGGAAWENRGTLAGAGALSAGAGLLMGGGINGLLKRLPGVGGVASRLGGGMLGGALADATGVQKVYVVNALEIGQGVGNLSGLGAGMAGAAGVVGKAGLVGLAGGAGYAVGSGLNALDENYLGGAGGNLLQSGMSGISKLMGGTGIMSNEEAFSASGANRFDGSKIETAVERGLSKSTIKLQQPLTNPSSVEPRGSAR